MNIAYSFLVFTIWFLSTYFTIVFILLLVKNNKKLNEKKRLLKNENAPLVTIIVPAYNEGSKIEYSINSLTKLDYPTDKLQILIINDGSSDNTAKIARKAIKPYPYMELIDNKNNAGKAARLNQGIKLAKGDYVATMDADSELEPQILRKSIPYFTTKKVGAVTVSVEVKKPKKLLERIIDLEYIIGLSLAIKALSFLNAVHVTPGPFSIYRTHMLEEIGYFDENIITEDMEIAYRIQKAKYTIECCNNAVVQTIIPNTLKELYIQRKRWYSGAIHTLIKHRTMFFDSKNGSFAYVMPYTYILITFGIFVFLFSMFLLVKNMVTAVSFYSLTGFNFFAHWSLSNIDLLTVNSLTFFGLFSMSMTMISAIIFLRLSNKRLRTRKIGFMGYFFLFFLYQIFWISSFYSVLTSKKVSWR